MKSSVTVSLVSQIKNGPWIFSEPLEESIFKAAELGFDGVELFTASSDSINSDILATLLGKYNIKLSAVGTGAGKIIKGLTLTDPNTETRREAITFISDMIRFGARFGAPAIIGSMQGNSASVTLKEQSITWLVEGLNLLGDIAEKEGVKLIFEALNRYETNLINQLEEGTKLIHKLDTKNVTLLADLFHMNIEEKSITDSILTYGTSIGYVHFADSNRRPIGMGHLQIVEIANALNTIGYNEYVSAEAFPWPDPEAAARQTIQSFKKYFQY